MDIEQYIEERLEKQRIWYEKKANANKKRYMLYQRAVILLGSFIPIKIALLHIIPGVSGYSAPLSALLSALIAIIASFDKLQTPQTNWFNYRANEEALKKEPYLYRFRVGPYKGLDDEECTNLLVERSESIISADIARFTTNQSHEVRERKKVPEEEKGKDHTGASKKEVAKPKSETEENKSS